RSTASGRSSHSEFASTRKGRSRRLAIDNPVLAVGRRKESIARVRLSAGQGTITVNERAMTEYFSRRVLQQAVLAPLKAVDSQARYDVAVKVSGGGVSGQAGAIVQGLAR